MTRYAQVAVEFASGLVARDFVLAWELLAPPLREELTPERLRERLYGMFSEYTDGEPTAIHYDEAFSLAEWPGKQPGDVGWAYVGILGEDFAEAVAVIVADVDGALLIREVEWGQP